MKFKSAKNMMLFELLSQLKSIHCSKYLSINMKENYVSFKKYFWLIIIVIALITGVYLSIEQLSEYLNSKEKFKLTDLDEDNLLTIETPKLDLCIITDYRNDLLLENRNFDKYIFELDRSIRENLTNILTNTSNILNEIESLYKKISFIYSNSHSQLPFAVISLSLLYKTSDNANIMFYKTFEWS